VKDAIEAAAAIYTEDPEQTAAASVVTAVDNADVAGSTADNLKTAASAAAELLNRTPTAEETAEYNAALDVSDAAQAVVTQDVSDAAQAVVTQKVAVKDAIEAAAAIYTEDPEQTAAASIVTAVNTAEAKAGSTADDLKAAASAAAELLNPGPQAKAKIFAGSAADPLNLEAASEGSWGNGLEVTVTVPEPVTEPGDEDHPVFSPTDAAAAKDLGLLPGDIFNVYVNDTIANQTESFLNVSVAESAQRIDRVLEDQSALLRVVPADDPSLSALPATRPAATTNVTAQAAGTASDGEVLNYSDFTGTGMAGNKQGLYALENTDLFNLLCIPPHKVTGEIEGSLISAAATYAEKKRAFFIIDPPKAWYSKSDAKKDMQTAKLGTSKNTAAFFPRLRKPDPLRGNQLRDFVPCGAVAGVIARTDSTRGFWKAPAGLDASLKGVPALSIPLTDAENGELNPLGLNCLRAMGPAGRVIWGSRTLQGHDQLASEWKYLSVRRVALYIEESLYRGTHWVVFEPNDEPLWAQIRLNLGAFMHNMFRQGAFQGTSPGDAYFVKCDSETTTQNDINLGIVNILIGFAPLKPAEFVIIKIQQIAKAAE
jgi:phage tail sheath protein FI